jgi:hypothetical protein
MVAGIGDAETITPSSNCAVGSVAVANALPAIRERWFVSMKGDHGDGVGIDARLLENTEVATRKVLMIDIGGSNVKLMASGMKAESSFRSGLTAAKMVKGVIETVKD